MKLLRQSGDFPNKSVVEYATITVRIPFKFVPPNMVHPRERADFNIAVENGENGSLVFYPSPKGRLSHRILYLNGVELANRFADHLRSLFKGRRYANDYTLEVEVRTTTATATATNAKSKCSKQVQETLAAAISDHGN